MIGYYIHHVGRGHCTRAAAVTALLDEPVVGLSSLPAPTAGPWAGWRQLARDDGDPAPDDPTGHGTLHWVPKHDEGLRGRMAALARWIDAERPSCVVVDVSVEVAALIRLMGVPVVVVGMPGDRDDPAHQLGYRLADAVLAFWPREVYDPPWLGAHHSRVHHVGALSRYDGRRSAERAGAIGGYGVVLSGSGGGGVTTDDLAQLPADRRWHVLGGHGGWVEDPWPLLCGADVVVTHAGQNALAEVAAARRPAVVVPRARPHGEQARTAAALAAAGIAVVEPVWPSAARWPAVLDAAVRHGGQRWDRWHDGGAAARAAAVVTAVARRPVGAR